MSNTVECQITYS